jgi:hypothetical protein
LETKFMTRLPPRLTPYRFTRFRIDVGQRLDVIDYRQSVVDGGDHSDR